MKTSIKILRALLVALFAIVIGVPVISYVMLSTDWAQQRMRLAGEEALTRLLGTEVRIGEISFSPFTRLNLEDIIVLDDYGDTALAISDIYTRIELSDLLLSKKMVVDYAVISGMKARIFKETPESPLNISNIIKKFKKDDQKNDSSPFDFRLNDVEIVDSYLSYDVISADSIPGKFDINHISLDNFNIQVFAPLISNDEYQLRLRNLSFNEQSGFSIQKMRADVLLTKDNLSVENADIRLPYSFIKFSDIDLPIDGFETFSILGKEIPVDIGIEEGSQIYFPDFKAFVPNLIDYPYMLNLDFQASGVLDDITLEYLNVKDGDGLVSFKAGGKINGLPTIEQIQLSDFNFEAETRSYAIEKIFSKYGNKLPANTHKMLSNLGSIQATGQLDGNINTGKAKITANTTLGKVLCNAKYLNKGNNAFDINGNVEIDEYNLGKLISNNDLGLVSAKIEGDITLLGKKLVGNTDLEIQKFDFKNYTYKDITLQAELGDSLYSVDLVSKDPSAILSMSTKLASSSSGYSWGALRAYIGSIDLDTLNLYNKYPGYKFSAQINAHGEGDGINNLDGVLSINDIRYVNSNGQGLKIKRFGVDIENMDNLPTINIHSDILNGSVQGKYNIKTISGVMQTIFANVFPSLVTSDIKSQPVNESESGNELSFDFVVDKAENFCQFFKLPVSILDPISITGELSESRRMVRIDIDGDWLVQGDKLIEDTYLSFVMDGWQKKGDLYLTSHYPTKKGPMNIIANIIATDGLLTSDIDWQLEREIPINGQIQFNTFINRDYDSKLVTTVEFEPGEINFGNEVWAIQPSTIIYKDKNLTVENFALRTPTQSININGKASENDFDVLLVNLDNINLIEIFETLEIDKAMIGGYATGKIYCSDLFSSTPDIHSENFFVKDIGYNRCVIGDADLEVNFDPEIQAFCFDASVLNELGDTSHIKGTLTPMTEELDFYFDANHVKVGFLKPFMSAFCSDIEGYATGNAHLYGNFKYIDLEGDIEADSVRLKIDFTNTWYSASTPLHIEPGIINLDNITIYDIYGNTAKLNGFVKHKFFKQPSFEFAITEARNFLSYDISKNDNPRWYGTIYGNGSAFVKGEPGVVDISVNMSTAPNSTFTFELLDSEFAEEYSFITFNDVTPQHIVDDVTEMVIESKSEKKIQELAEQDEEDTPTAYNLDITVDINSSALVTIVMDPIGGDCIRAYGSGLLRMTYGSVDQDLMMLGSYTLERGDYNFTLQNIIIKDFKIRQGSSITFNGDPYAAVLDIDAIYTTNANLSDLDESFLNDKDLNRTNVPVYAVLKVTGNMQQPDIAFDLEFPTLTQDIYRKVKSIVSTDDMMNRQIIYLLALNRFYTPDYMASTTKGNELFSVASSTISSQLSSMLGKLSDNWSIAPNLRSDRGDFSDVEVDVALSSSLLNNRLLFNGNFGYRDKSLNTNQFIGDFDIEYLLDRSGLWRLKAYNRYNDQNYYLRTAQTTQGIGVVARRDFDNIFSFLKKKTKEDNLPDSISQPDIVPADSLKAINDTLIITPAN